MVEPSDILHFRKEHGLTQQDLGAFLGVSQRTVSRWERGQDHPADPIATRLRMLLGEGSESPWPAVYDAVRNAPVPVALVNGEGAILVASSSHPGAGQLCRERDESVPTVLVVEDDEAVLKATRAALRRWQFLSVGVADGEAAVRLVEEGQIRPNAAIIDFRLPGALDGVDTAHALRTRLPGLAVLIITGEQASDRGGKIAASGLPLIAKPVDPRQIKLTLSSLLAHNPSGGDAA